MNKVRTRLAPSPTGYVHVGTIRTALYAWIIAKQNNGAFILRIEDTDKKREVAGSEEHIFKSLKALGLNYTEGPDEGGPFGPYRQSERLNIYKEWAQKLIAMGRAYADPYSPEEIDKFRQQSKANKKPFLYRDYRPETPPKWTGDQPLRFLSEPKDYSWHDEVMGDLSAKSGAVDDFILIKSDGYPTYNFAHLVDDYLMEITHIIRSQEFIASVPKFLNLYEALNIDRPIFITPPPVLGPDGRKKLSKRDGAKDVLEYLEEGYLSEALLNFFASLGWNDGSEQEIYSIDQLIKNFSVKGVQRSGANFDDKRLLWMNGAHIRLLSLDELYEKSKDYFPKSAESYDDDYKKKVLSLLQERLKYLGEIPSLTAFFFEDLNIYPQLIEDNPKLSAIDKKTLVEYLNMTAKELEQSDFTVEDLTKRLNALLEKTGQKPAVLFSLIRIATTQSSSSPGLFDSLNLLGKERSLKRIQEQVEALS
jgi:glutamyl-tRNA synthetase